MVWIAPRSCVATDGSGTLTEAGCRWEPLDTDGSRIGLRTSPTGVEFGFETDSALRRLRPSLVRAPVHIDR